ncbi:glycosyltransferase [Halomicroarcula limicola]|uniref:Glycosyltransferase n=1 Tax=Haloarcula limicola TaxID=1429915 RepID=A0A8J8C977_9EURY|nr:glycosyltransferase [Halomicroarcula limicola]MBV0925225.1 glycosyltransferase [Halomicroarcula limicola]
MAEIALFHPGIMRHGGGESVAAHTIEALTDRHSLTVFSLDEPNVKELNKRHGTDIRPEEIQYQNPLPILNRTLRPSITVVNEFLGSSLQLDALASALIQAVTSYRSFAEYDLFFSTSNEFVTNTPVIQYIHFPIYSSFQHARFEPWAPSKKYRLYRSICRRVAGAEDMMNKGSTFVANSNWTANLVRESYNTDVEVVYPPVRTSDFDPNDWMEKEDGFIAIGRIHPSKKQKTIIEILDRLHKRGASYHLHLVGGIGSESYAAEVRKLAESRPYVHLEGYLDREEMVELVEKHKYGLHGRQYEHFGISVAELVAGGCIPFVPDGGGQVEIVGKRSQLMYENPSQAVEKILSVTGNQHLQRDIQKELRGHCLDFSTDRFKKKIQSLVSSELSGCN